MDTSTGLIVLSSVIGSKELVVKILGPTAEYLGEGIKKYTEKQLANLRNIFENAGKKLGSRIEDPGRIPPKILKGILHEGSFCEDEVGAEYFGGVLASSKTEIERDDRGAHFIELLSRLSSYQIRSHYLFYHVILTLYAGSALNPNLATEVKKMKTYIHMDEYKDGMQFSEEEKPGPLTLHSLFGLRREDLIGEEFGCGSAEVLSKGHMLHPPGPGIVFQPSAYGAELFLWAYGYGNIPLRIFLTEELEFSNISDISIPKQSINITPEM